MEEPNKHVELYPELSAKSLAEVLREKIAFGSEYISGFEETGGSSCWALMQCEERYVQITVGIEQRCITASFRESGVQLATANTESFESMCQMLSDWSNNGFSSGEMEQKYFAITVSPGAAEYEKGPECYVEYLWKRITTSEASVLEYLTELLRLASENPILNKLAPYSSMNKLLFGQYTGYPFSENSPGVYSLDGITYTVTFKGAVFHKLTVEEAVEKLVSLLPENYGPAKHGRAN